MPELLEILGPIQQIDVIASGRGVKIGRWLIKTYGGKNWRKLKGFALIRDTTNQIYQAEIHWYECHGIGRRRFKIKDRRD
jgi:hypothetical protein